MQSAGMLLLLLLLQAATICIAWCCNHSALICADLSLSWL
jgi:putative effector of murein hydrolase LrgA (UPF0299 family)